MSRSAWIVLLLSVSACSCEEEPGVLDGGGGRDAVVDAGPVADGSVGVDGAILDLGIGDANGFDGGPVGDGGGTFDAGSWRGSCRSSADCGGRACLPVPAGEDPWWTCAYDVVSEATSCTQFDSCCESAHCAAGPGGFCSAAIPFYCGGAPPPPGNVCLYDECAVDGDCGGGRFCVPPTAFGEPTRRCAQAECLHDRDCSARSGGRCLPFFSPCTDRFDGFYCTYNDSPCRQDQDCTRSPFDYCAPGAEGHTECREFIPPP